MTDASTDPPPRRKPRWGLRTIGFLVLGFVAVVTAQAMGHHTAGTLGSLILALLGAAYCSIMGLRAAKEGGYAGLLTGRGPRR